MKNISDQILFAYNDKSLCANIINPESNNYINIINSTFVGNKTQSIYGGGGIYIYEDLYSVLDNVMIQNTIVYDNYQINTEDFFTVKTTLFYYSFQKQKFILFS